MEANEEINHCLEEVRASTDISFRTGKLNRVYDILDFNNIDIDYLGTLSYNLIDMIVAEDNKKVRSNLFDLLEKVYKKNTSIEPPLDRLVACFDEDDPAMIANTLLLFPLNGDKKYAELAKNYLNHHNEFIRNNAEYVLKYLNK